MKTSRRIIAVVLALAIVVSLSCFAGAASTTTNTVASTPYAEAEGVLSGLGVFQGYEGGGYGWYGNVTRAETATLIYRIITGQTAGNGPSGYTSYGSAYSDVYSGSWYEGYIGYCSKNGYIKGYGDGSYHPNDSVTGYQILAMGLRLNNAGSFEGDYWKSAVASAAAQAGIVIPTGVDLNEPASRGLVAELLWQTMQQNSNIMSNVFGLKQSTTSDIWGRPSAGWTEKGAIVYSTGSTLVKTYTTEVSEKQIASDLGLTGTADIAAVYEDGLEVSSKSVCTNGIGRIDPKCGSSYVGAQGLTTEVYQRQDGKLIIVQIHTWLARVETVKADGTASIAVYNNSCRATYFTGKDTSLKLNEWLLVTINKNGTASTGDDYIVDYEAATTQNCSGLICDKNGHITTGCHESCDFYYGRPSCVGYITTGYTSCGYGCVIYDRHSNVIGVCPCEKSACTYTQPTCGQKDEITTKIPSQQVPASTVTPADPCSYRYNNNGNTNVSCKVHNWVKVTSANAKTLLAGVVASDWGFNLVHAATCTEDGTALYICTNCKTRKTDIDPAGHTFTSKITTPATCTTDGKKTYSCTKCNYTYEEIIPATGKHNVKAYAVVGDMDYCVKCENCSEEWYVYVSDSGVTVTNKDGGLAVYTVKENNSSWTITISGCNSVTIDKPQSSDQGHDGDSGHDSHDRGSDSHRGW